MKNKIIDIELISDNSTVGRAVPGTIKLYADISGTLQQVDEEGNHSPIKNNVKIARYTLNSDQVIPDQAVVVVDFNTLEKDDNNLVTTGPDWKFTADKDGTYYASVMIFWQPDATGTRDIQLYKNGSLYRYLSLTSGSGANINNGYIELDLVVADYIQFVVQQSSGNDLAIQGSSITSYCIIGLKP